MNRLLQATKGFTFHTTKSIVSGAGSINQTSQLVHNLGAMPGDAVLVVTDSGIIDLGIEIPLLNSLKDEGFDPIVYMDTVPDPHQQNVLDALELVKDTNAKAIVGFGGGSSMDVAKLVSFLGHNSCKQHLSDIFGVDMCRGPRLPLIQIPTTAGTGSEVTPISIITTGEQEKKGIVSNILLPDVAVLDGELTLSLPKDVTAATGIDAMVHAIEAYTSKFKKNPLSDVFAMDALKLLSTNIRQVCADGDDLNARSQMLLGSMYAGMAFSNSPVAAVHALAYPIGARFGVPHGLSNSLMLPHVVRFNSQEPLAKELYDEISTIVFPNQSTNEFSDNLLQLAKDLELPTTLKEVGIQEKDLGALTEDAMKQTRLLPNNLREVGPSEASDLYTAAL